MTDRRTDRNVMPDILLHFRETAANPPKLGPSIRRAQDARDDDNPVATYYALIELAVAAAASAVRVARQFVIPPRES